MRITAVILALLVLSPVVALASARATVVAPGQEASDRPDRATLRFTKHARARMRERGVSAEAVITTIERGERFRYFHNSKWKTGYYDAGRLLFIATDGDVVITVISDAGRRYVDSLKRNRP